MPADSMNIATVDFACFESGTHEQRSVIGTAIAQAFQEHGFLKLINHGISRKTVEELFQWSKRFFSLPDEVKGKAPHPPHPTPNRGWSGVGMENTSIHGSQGKEKAVSLIDMKECFDQGSAQDVLYENLWLPESDLPGFRAFMEEYFLICYRCQLQILEALEIGLDLPPKTLTQRHDRQENEMRLTHYPQILAAQLQDGRRTRISEHTDFGTITLLFQDAVGGLEIENPLNRGQFEPIESSSIDEMIVNIGDCLERWSNGRLRSTRHRVHISRKDLASQSVTLPERLSVAYFAKPNRSSSVRTLPEMCVNGEAVLYNENWTAGEFVLQRSSTTYAVVA